MKSEKHRVRFHFWQHDYSRKNAGETLSFEDREFESFAEALAFSRVMESPLIKIFNCLGHLVHNSNDRDAHLTYA